MNEKKEAKIIVKTNDELFDIVEKYPNQRRIGSFLHSQKLQIY